MQADTVYSLLPSTPGDDQFMWTLRMPREIIQKVLERAINQEAIPATFEIGAGEAHVGDLLCCGCYL
jgi:hypothetical protein